MKRLRIILVMLISLNLVNYLYSFENSANISGLEEYYTTFPDVANCKAGTLKDSEKQAILQEVNQIRALHKLKPVEYRSQYDANTAEAALMLAANDDKIGNPDNPHLPPNSWKCFTNNGKDGCQNSNLAYRWYMGTPPASNTSLNMWMTDYGVSECGHRRWIIDPFLKFIAFGRADGQSKRFQNMSITTMTIYVISNDKQNITDWQGEFVAYPFQDYPSKYFYDGMNRNWLLSFTAIFDKSNYWNNSQVKFNAATIEIKDSKGNNISATDVSYANDGYGVPNIIKWNIPGLKKDEKYTVTIKNVDYKGTKKDFTYWFRVTDNPVNPMPPPAPTLVSPANNQTNVTDFKLTWNLSENAESYILQIAKSNDFKTALKEYKDLKETSFIPTGLESSTKYFWRVKAVNTAGESQWSAVWNFTTANLVLKAAKIIYPENSAVSVPITPKFIWTSVANATSYTIKLANFASDTVFTKEFVEDTVYQFSDSEKLKEKTLYELILFPYAPNYKSTPTSVYFYTEDLSSITGDVPNDESILIYPNPAKDEIIIEKKISNIAFKKLEIADLAGKVLFAKDLSNTDSDNNLIQFKISNLSSGLYMVRIYTNGKIVSYPMIISR